MIATMKTQMFVRIVDQVRATFEEYDSYSKLENIFNTLKSIYREVIEIDGFYTDKLPHKS
jgi:hypothetical protein